MFLNVSDATNKTKKSNTFLPPQVCIRGFPEKGICPPVSSEIMFTKSKEEPMGSNFSVFNLKQAFKLQLEGSGHERKGTNQRAINNLLLYKMLA